MATRAVNRKRERFFDSTDSDDSLSGLSHATRKNGTGGALPRKLKKRTRPPPIIYSDDSDLDPEESMDMDSSRHSISSAKTVIIETIDLTNYTGSTSTAPVILKSEPPTASGLGGCKKIILPKGPITLENSSGKPIAWSYPRMKGDLSMILWDEDSLPPIS